MLSQLFYEPFREESVRHSLAAVLALALSAGPVGVFLMLRRMSLVGDAMAHAILPGAAVGFLLSGLNLFAMTAGGLIAGFVVALLAGVVSRVTDLKEDASLATFYLASLALGVTIVSVKGTNIDLLHVLFGNILAMDDQTLLVIAFNATLTLIVLAVIYRPLVIESVDPLFLRTVSRAGGIALNAVQGGEGSSGDHVGSVDERRGLGIDRDRPDLRQRHEDVVISAGVTLEIDRLGAFAVICKDRRPQGERAHSFIRIDQLPIEVGLALRTAAKSGQSEDRLELGFDLRLRLQPHEPVREVHPLRHEVMRMLHQLRVHRR